MFLTKSTTRTRIGPMPLPPSLFLESLTFSWSRTSPSQAWIGRQLGSRLSKRSPPTPPARGRRRCKPPRSSPSAWPRSTFSPRPRPLRCPSPCACPLPRLRQQPQPIHAQYRKSPGQAPRLRSARDARTAGERHPQPRGRRHRQAHPIHDRYVSQLPLSRPLPISREQNADCGRKPNDAGGAERAALGRRRRGYAPPDGHAERTASGPLIRPAARAAHGLPPWPTVVLDALRAKIGTRAKMAAGPVPPLNKTTSLATPHCPQSVMPAPLRR
jgi:hypothetical protein